MSKANIEFVSYDGEWPCLCYGRFIVRINGKQVIFGLADNGNYSRRFEEDGFYPAFWHSGGRVWFENDYRESHVEQGPWELNSLSLDHYPKVIADSMDALLELFNEKVPHGCCGGCI